jgi:hypothetical protein
VEFGIDVWDRTVEAASLIISVEECVIIEGPVVTSVVSVTVDANVDRLFVLSTIVVGPTDDVSKLDEIMFEV